jgi:hypothetical protein
MAACRYGVRELYDWCFTEPLMKKGLLRIGSSTLRAAKVALVLISFEFGLASAQVHLKFETNLQPAKPAKKADAPSACPKLQDLKCPLPVNNSTAAKGTTGPSGSSLSSPPDSKGSGSQAAMPHTVTLTWNANPMLHDPVRDAVGYCLYRRTTANIPKPTPNCADCEQVNQTPVNGTKYEDKLMVAGDITYYYVAAAINQCGTISAASNEAPAKISNTPGPKTPASTSRDAR